MVPYTSSFSSQSVPDPCTVYNFQESILFHTEEEDLVYGRICWSMKSIPNSGQEEGKNET